MVFAGKFKGKKAGGHRIGQAQNGNGMLNAFNGNGQNANMLQGQIDVTDPTGDVVRNLSGFQGQQLSENLTLDQTEVVTGVDIDVEKDDNGVTYVLTQEDTGAQAMARFPAAQPQPQEDVCTFPAQSVQLQRQVTITNTAPQIVDITSDICGNVTGYTETMQRNMQATEWVATAGLQAGINGLSNFTVDANGEIVSTLNPNVVLANNLSVPQGVTVNSQQRVGKQRKIGGVPVRQVHAAPNLNKNAAYGAALMKQWRGA